MSVYSVSTPNVLLARLRTISELKTFSEELKQNKTKRKEKKQTKQNQTKLTKPKPF